MERNYPTATAAIATPESDARLRLREMEAGSLARREGRPRDSCPWSGGLVQNWWLKGWDTPIFPETSPITSTKRKPSEE